MHFDDTLRSEAAAAFTRAGVLHSAVTWHQQLVSRGQQIVSGTAARLALTHSSHKPSQPRRLSPA